MPLISISRALHAGRTGKPARPAQELRRPVSKSSTVSTPLPALRTHPEDDSELTTPTHLAVLSSTATRVNPRPVPSRFTSLLPRLIRSRVRLRSISRDSSQFHFYTRTTSKKESQKLTAPNDSASTPKSPRDKKTSLWGKGVDARESGGVIA